MAGTAKSSPLGTKAATRAGKATQASAKAQASTETKSRDGSAKPRGAPRPTAETVRSGTAQTGADAKFRRPDLIDAVAARTALKRSDAKQVLDLVLEEIGHALDTHDDLALQPLGTMSVKRRKPVTNGDMLTLKLKRRAVPGAPSPLAKPGSES